MRKCIAGRVHSAFIPPAIFSIEEFIDCMYETIHQPPLRKLETIDAVAFLFDLHRGMARPIGGGGFLNLETFFSLGVRIFRDLEELVIEDVDRSRFSGLEAYVDPSLPPEIARSLQSLSYFYDSFYPALSRAGLSSRSERYRFVSASISRDVMPWQRVIFAGFYGLTVSEKRLFVKIFEWDETVFLFQDGPGIDDQLSFLGMEFPRNDRHDEIARTPFVHFHGSPDSHGQVFALSTLLGKQIEDVKGHEIGNAVDCSQPRISLDGTAVVLPAPDSLFSVLYHALPGIVEDDYNISLGYPLERTPTWGFLSSLMQLCISMDGGRLYVPDYLDFVLHPYTKNIYLGGKAELTRIMFHAVEEVLLQDRTRSFVSLEEIEEDSDIFGVIENRVSQTESFPSHEEMKAHLRDIHNGLIRSLASFEDIGDFAEKIMAVLHYVYDRSSARLHPFFHPFAESFMEQLDLLKRSGLKRLAFSEKQGYFRFLKRYITSCFTPFDGTPLHGLQVLGFLETRNLHFTRVYILDMNEDVIPDSGKEESLIPMSVRKVLNLPTYRERDMLSAYYFDTLIKGSDEIHLFFAENGRKEKSRFVERLLWEKQKKEKINDSASYVSTLNYRLSLEDRRPSPIEKTPEIADLLRSRPLDATSIDAYLRCPVQYYYRYVLNLKKKDDLRADIERVEVGRLVHRILFAYFEKRKGTILSPREIDEESMKDTAESLFQETYGRDPTGAVFLLRRQILRQMAMYMRRYELPLVTRLPVKILELEQKVEREADGLRFVGIVDRIDVRDGITCIVDYKTANSSKRYGIAFDKLEIRARESWGRAVGSIQLPFYLFLTEKGEVNPDARQAMFLLLGRAHIDSGIELRLFREGDDRWAAYEKAKQVILGLAEEIGDPGTPFDPSLRKPGACQFCDYQRICGTE